MKGKDGKYHVKGHSYEKLIGSRAQVWHGTAYKTKGDLVKSDLLMTKRGKIISSAITGNNKKPGTPKPSIQLMVPSMLRTLL